VTRTSDYLTMERMLNYIVLLRTEQYVKNLFIFLPLFFAQKIGSGELFFNTLISFLAFSLLASATYIFNDYHDIEHDRKHPNKKNRPLASGTVSPKEAVLMLVFFLVAGMAIAVFLTNRQVLFLCILYLALNFAYTIKLKHIAIIDIFVIASNFVIRIFVGSVAANIELSMWIILMTFLLALFMALAKRRDDLLIFLEKDNKTRPVLDGYSIGYLDSSMMIMASITIVSYIMYTVSHEVIIKFQTDKLYLTALWVILGVMRYLQITFVERASGSPTDVLLKDRFIQLTLCAWLLTFSALIYKLPEIIGDALARLFAATGLGG
jgi:decaprenyl-phosphate phosphoribosyltransferase